MQKINIVAATDDRAILLDYICCQIWQQNSNILSLLGKPVKDLQIKANTMFAELQKAIGLFENCVRNAYEVTSHHGNFEQCPLIVLYHFYCMPDDFEDFMKDRGYQYSENISHLVSECINRYS